MSRGLGDVYKRQDGVWCRIGSSNLNSASLLGNWELDVGVLDAGLASQLEGLFLADLASSKEIVLPGGPSIAGRAISTTVGMQAESLDPDRPLSQRLEERFRSIGTAPGRLSLASMVRAGESLGDALAGNRALGREDRTVLGLLSAAVLTVALISAIFPTMIGVIVAFVAAWLGIVTAARAYGQAVRARAEEKVLRERAELQDRLEAELNESMRDDG